MKLGLTQTNYWDGVASEKKFTHDINWEFINKNIPKDSAVLDYGCGYGRLVKEFVEKGYRNIVGMDNSSEMIKRAIKENTNLDFRLNHEPTIPFNDDSFNVILLFAVLTCIPGNQDQSILLKELKRILKPNGFFYLSDYLINTNERNKERYNKSTVGPYGTFELDEGVQLRHHQLEYLEQKVFDEFEVCYRKEFQVTTMNGNVSNAVQIIGKFMS